MVGGSDSPSTGFSFDAPRALPAKNPLLARTRVTHRAAPQPADAPLAPMGNSLSDPVVLTRHGNHGHNQRVHRSRKVPFEKGFSQMDWMMLARKNSDLSGLGPGASHRLISMEEVAEHKTPQDCWTVLRGKVYNLTPYLQYHPGGAKILMSVAGKDGTAAFDKYHAWVNADFLLSKCLVGKLEPPSVGGEEKAAE